MQDYLQLFADWLTYSILGLVQGTPLASSVNFFIYDSIKVTLLLAVIVFAVAIVRTYITPQKVKKWVAGRTEGVGNVSPLSSVSPRRSAPAPQSRSSSVLSRVRRAARHHVLVPDRVAAHQRGRGCDAACDVRLADRAHLHRIRSIIAIIAGIIIGRLHLEGEVEEFVWKCKMHDQAGESDDMEGPARFRDQRIERSRSKCCPIS